MADLGVARLVDRIDTAPRFTAADASRLDEMFRAAGTDALLEAVLKTGVAGRVAVVSSFGAESAVLLHLVARIAPDTPVLFLDTGKHFAETLAYRDALVRRLGLTDLRVLTPDPALIAARDATGLRWSYDPDGCCEIRKVLPLAAALTEFDATLTGRKAFQAATRANLPRFELDGADALGRLKINPLIDWAAADLAAYAAAYGLPPHPLVAAGYPSIGCSPCTSQVAPGEDPRSGRWRGWDKTECGIHSAVELGPDGALPPGYEPFL
ncbi:MAG: phosphoadenylyl-sulfate reductase [Cypionkella sp.]